MLMWLENELTAAQEALQDAITDSGHASPRAKYWNGYVDAITNALNELSGPGDTN